MVVPLPLDNMLSINRISPPTLVHASPVTTPGTFVVSERLLGRGTPRGFHQSFLL